MSKVESKPAASYALSLISGEARGPVAAALRAALALLAVLYRIGLAAFLLPYRLGIRKRRRLPRPVISIGNMTFGGTGKTPAVRTIAAGLQARGLRPVILSRGHGGRRHGSPTIVSDGAKRRLSAAESGDEPAMLADLLPGVPVVVGKNRWRSGQLAIREFDPDVILLDDALQYWQLHRDVDVVLINAVEPFGYGRLMPRGALREPLAGLKRADVVVITNSDRATSDGLAGIKRRIAGIAPDSLIVEAVHKPVGLRFVSGETVGIDWLRGRQVCSACSIGAPGLFANSLAAMGAEVVLEFNFPDHHLWSGDEIETIAVRAAEVGAEAILTTEKDAVKLPAGELRLPVLAVDVMMDFGEADVISAVMEKARVIPSPLTAEG
ncbi:MAG: tetraacyldisaccharide 4'-kinase [Armatimonadota bacterium]|nr:tetraacyldisaccharide 4'-kinase [Armatimonadota bacterium]